MAIVEATLERGAPEQIDYLVREEDGTAFHVAFLREIVDEWQQQLARSSHSVNLEEIAQELAEEIIAQQPTPNELSDGFLVTLDNGFATPLAAIENIRNAGLAMFHP